MPRDSFGREIDYLRISVTDRCNLRCTYCLPLEPTPFLPDESVLTPAEIELVVRAATSVGFRRFRLTGGEPTLRADLLEIVERVAAVPGLEDLSLTTNGMLLERLARPLKAAGLRRVNVHVDSLETGRIERVMRFARLGRILAGIDEAEAAGLTPIKLNAVVVRGENEATVVDLARLTLEHPWHVRFVELMPIGEGSCASVARGSFVSSAEVRARIEAALGRLEPLPPIRASDESKNHRLPAGRGVVGFISPVSEPYCGSCNRLRLTADGRFHLCLLHDDELDVRSVLRSGGNEDAVRQTLLQAVRTKPSGHQLGEGVSPRARLMHAIGG